MATTYVSAEIEQLTTTGSRVYTAPETSTAIIIAATANNEEATSSTITVNIVKSGGSVSVSNEYITDKPIVRSEILSEIIGHVLNSGDYVSALAADGSRINLKLSLRVITS